MEFVIVTGLSGSGKSTALNALEDIGYFCMDNLPLELLPKLAQLFGDTVSRHDKVAMVIDIRLGAKFLQLDDYIGALRDSGINVKVLYMDCELSVAIKRYKETRRKHPLDDEVGGDMEVAVKTEDEILLPFRTKADFYIDTSQMPVTKLKESILDLFLDNLNDSISVRLISFGFKHGSPRDADIIFDVRCLPNPFYIDELKNKTGMDNPVSEYVMQSEISRELLEKLCALISFTLPEYIKEGKSRLVIAIGCTGGHHRSVTFCEKIAAYLETLEYKPVIVHRDITK
ncbi:MAG: RNase adapter RapZ [Oscillospiraceae bacterium]|nr:RNase adapter RapZ [Oscillospiraceae bacterium]